MVRKNGEEELTGMGAWVTIGGVSHCIDIRCGFVDNLNNLNCIVMDASFYCHPKRINSCYGSSTIRKFAGISVDRF